ncbi:MAG: N,N-dimethylformamidase beta subunit family domain-containing protein, partial [Pseudomonadales bacterium]
MREYPQGRKDLVAYASTLTARPGERFAIMASAHFNGHYTADLVRVYCGDSRPHGTGFDVRAVPEQASGRYPARTQTLKDGSYGRTTNIDLKQSFTAAFKIYPTTPERACTVLAGAGVAVTLQYGRLQVRVQDTVLQTAGELLRARRWHEVAVSVTQTGTIKLWLRALGQGAGEPAILWQSLTDSPGGPQQASAGPWWLACADADGDRNFNGRLEALQLLDGDVLPELDAADQMPNLLDRDAVARWDFGTAMQTQQIPDLTGQHTLVLHQHPTRAVTGSRWDGSVQDWRQNPDHYAAIAFHEDDMTDAGWETDFEWQLPAALPSGVYAVRLQPEPAVDPDTADQRVPEYVPLFVGPGAEAQRAPVAMLMSTATYLAYGNQRLASADGVVGSKPPRNPNDLYLLDHPEVGLSTYDHHADGGGVHYASAHRPLLNMRPGSIMWSFNADTNLLAWLTAVGQDCDVITDHDLHRQGAAALAPYQAVITGTHPEYYSTAMRDGLEDWLGAGGRLMYMGGNGFYWRIAFDPQDDGVLEVRRAEDGTRAWIAKPGEYHHSFSGEYGGLWQRQGRAPNALVGIGFTAQGFDGGTHYRWNAAAKDPR